MKETRHVPGRMRWAHFRFGVISPLLTSPPDPGELAKILDELAAQSYRHPITHLTVRFGRSTIERWFYAAKNEPNEPVKALERKVHALAGKHPTVNDALRAAIEAQHRAHPRWSFKLHHDNLRSLARTQPEIGPVPSIAVIRRYMKGRGLTKQKAPRRRTCAEHEATFVAREKRSYEVGHVHGLWHSDFHECSRSVVTEDGEWKKPFALAFLDDCSRVVCHMQWYLHEDAQSFVHGFSQAILKRGLCRKLLTDNGKPMTAHEVEEGCARLSIEHDTTLPYTPEQNGKQESFWGQVEGRLIAMLEGERELTLQKLNEATQAWVELEYHRARHSELGKTPLERLLEGPSVVRPSPSSDALRRAFRTEVVRTQRRSDGTLTVHGVRFELPSRYRVLLHPVVRYARWDLSNVDLVDARTGVHLATLLPVDKLANADGLRRVIEPVDVDAITAPAASSGGIAPLLAELMCEYAATGLPPAYVPDSRTLQRTDDLNDHGDETP
jgi:transposase InsO family protein